MLTPSSFFVAVDGRTATGSGIDLLSFICVQVVFMIVMGKTVATLGRYKVRIFIPCPLKGTPTDQETFSAALYHRRTVSFRSLWLR